jgi:hypothetical protein
MDRCAALRYLHERHRGVVDAPHGDVPLETFHLDFFMLQARACELLDRRSERGVRRYFESIHHVLVEGDGDVRNAVLDHFLVPELVCHSDLAWAMERMPPLLAEICAKVRKHLEERFPEDWTDGKSA